MITLFWGGLAAIGAGIGLFAGEKEKKAKIRAQRQAEDAKVAAEQKGLDAVKAGTDRMVSEYEKGVKESIGTQKEYGQKAIDELRGGMSDMQQMYQDLSSQYTPFAEIGLRGAQRAEQQATDTDGQGSALYQLQQRLTSQAINRQAVARKGFGSGATMQLQSDAAQQLAAQEAERQFQRNMQLAQYGGQFAMAQGQAGERFGQQGMNVAGSIANIYGNLGSGIGGMQQQAGSAIGSAYGQLGSIQQQAFRNIGQATASSVLGQGDARAAQWNSIGQVGSGMLGYGMQMGMPMGGQQKQAYQPIQNYAQVQTNGNQSYNPSVQNGIQLMPYNR